MRARRIMYFMVHRFKEVAMMAETEIAKYQATHRLSRSSDNEHPMTSLKGGVPVDGLLATKAVSHFNLWYFTRASIQVDPDYRWQATS